MRDEVIRGLVEARRKIIDVASSLPREKQDEVFLGIWSIKDLLAHLVGWDYANIKSVREIQAGKTPSVFAHFDPEWASYNAQLVQQFRREDFQELLAEIGKSHDALLSFLQTLPPEEFDKDYGVRSPWGRVVTIASHLQAEIDDEQDHFEQMKQGLGIHAHHT